MCQRHDTAIIAHTHWCSCENCRFESDLQHVSTPLILSTHKMSCHSQIYINVFNMNKNTFKPTLMVKQRLSFHFHNLWSDETLFSDFPHHCTCLFSTSMHHLTPSRQPCPLLPFPVCVLPNTARTKPRTELWHKPPLTIIQMLRCTRCETTSYTMHICDNMFDELQKFHPIIWGHSGCI